MGNEGKVVVIGATGFVGRHVCQQLLAEGRAFTAVGRRPCPVGIPSHVYRQVDSLPSGVAQLRSEFAGAAAVIYLAARVHAMGGDGLELLPLYRRENLQAPLCAAREALDAGVRRFVYVSTIKVHGDGGGAPYRATDAPHPRGAYALSKYEAEIALQELFAAEDNASLAIVRPPLVYGVGVSANFERLFRWVAGGRPLPFGAVRNRRSLVGVRNLSDLLVRLVDAEAEGILLVSDGQALSTAELVRAIARAWNRPARLVPVPQFLLDGLVTALGRGDLAQRLWGSLEVDSAATERLLSWKPPVALSTELAAMVAASGRTPK